MSGEGDRGLVIGGGLVKAQQDRASRACGYTYIHACAYMRTLSRCGGRGRASFAQCARVAACACVLGTVLSLFHSGEMEEEEEASDQERRACACVPATLFVVGVYVTNLREGS